MALTVANLVLGGCSYITIDDTQYEVFGDDPVTIEIQADIAVDPVAGSPEPRIRCRNVVFIVTASLTEATLENLSIAWNQSGVSYGAASDRLYLGLHQTLPTHTLKVRGYGGQKSDESAFIYREYTFHKAVSYQPQPQSLNYQNTVVIPVKFYCYPDSSQPSGWELGYIEQDKQ